MTRSRLPAFSLLVTFGRCRPVLCVPWPGRVPATDIATWLTDTGFASVTTTPLRRSPTQHLILATRT